MKKFVLFFAVLLLGTSFSFADVLVLKNGKRMEIDGAFEVRGQFVVFKDLQGELRQLPTSIVDQEMSKKATQDLIAKREAAAARAAKKPPPKKVGSMDDIVNHVERTTGGREKVVTISTKGLQDYNETNERIVNRGVETGGGGGAAPAGAGDGNAADSGDKADKNAPPTAAQLSDPNYIASKRDELKKRHGEAAKEISDLDKKIKEAEYMRDVNASAAAQGVENYAGDDGEGDEDSSPYYDQMEKAEKHLDELKKQRAAKEAEVSAINKEAKQAGVRNYGQKPREGGQQNKVKASRDNRYGEDGRRKSLHGNDRSANQDSRYDENGKRRKINN